MERTGAEALVATLEAAGVEYVFGLCGHANLSILDALASSRIEFVPVRHEQDAAHMADAYFRFSLKPGVVLTTIGPGLANAVTGVWEAAMDSSAVVVIAGNVPTYMAGRDAFQELSLHRDSSQADVYRPFVKRAFEVRHQDSIPYVVARAFNFATQGRPSPVLIDVPMDLFGKVATYDIPDPARRRPTSPGVAAPAECLNSALDLLRAADAPLIHAGNGVTLSGGSEALVRLATALNIPVTTSMQAQGVIPSDHDLAAGYPGAVGTPTGNALCQMADVVLALGTRFSELEMNSWDPQVGFRFAGDAKLIQVDIDPHEVGRAYPVEIGLVGDARTVLEQMVALSEASGTETGEPTSLTRLREIRQAWSAEKDAALHARSDTIAVEQVIAALDQVMDEDSILLTDAGTFRHGVGHFFRMRQPQSFFLPSGLGTMGGSASAALGAKFARPEAQVVDLIGDGGFSAGSQCLATAVEQNLDLKWIILNNSSWDSIEAYQHIAYEGRVYGTRLETKDGEPYNPDFVGIAKAHGVAGHKVHDVEELMPTIRDALSHDGPFVVEVVVGPTKLKATGAWDVGTILKQEGAFKKNRPD